MPVSYDRRVTRGERNVKIVISTTRDMRADMTKTWKEKERVLCSMTGVSVAIAHYEPTNSKLIPEIWSRA